MTDATDGMTQTPDERISKLETRVAELEDKIQDFVPRKEVSGVVAKDQASRVA